MKLKMVNPTSLVQSDIVQLIVTHCVCVCQGACGTSLKLGNDLVQLALLVTSVGSPLVKIICLNSINTVVSGDK